MIFSFCILNKELISLSVNFGLFLEGLLFLWFFKVVSKNNTSSSFTSLESSTAYIIKSLELIIFSVTAAVFLFISILFFRYSNKFI